MTLQELSRTVTSIWRGPKEPWMLIVNDSGVIVLDRRSSDSALRVFLNEDTSVALKEASTWLNTQRIDDTINICVYLSGGYSYTSCVSPPEADDKLDLFLARLRGADSFVSEFRSEEISGSKVLFRSFLDASVVKLLTNFSRDCGLVVISVESLYEKMFSHAARTNISSMNIATPFECVAIAIESSGHSTIVTDVVQQAEPADSDAVSPLARQSIPVEVKEMLHGESAGFRHTWGLLKKSLLQSENLSQRRRLEWNLAAVFSKVLRGLSYASLALLILLTTQTILSSGDKELSAKYNELQTERGKLSRQIDEFNATILSHRTNAALTPAVAMGLLGQDAVPGVCLTRVSVAEGKSDTRVVSINGEAESTDQALEYLQLLRDRFPGCKIDQESLESADARGRNLNMTPSEKRRFTLSISEL